MVPLNSKDAPCLGRAEDQDQPGHHARHGRSSDPASPAFEKEEPGDDPRNGCVDHPAMECAARIILSFDVEDHFLIEAAAGLKLTPELKTACTERLAPSTQWILDQLERHGRKATFFIVGQTALREPGLVRAIHRAGHEVASHGWAHQRIQQMKPDAFREDLRRSKDALEQITGEAVVGYRAPTFSLVRRTGWAIDTLAELGILYDSSIYPVLHDRYGVPKAPRSPFLARGCEREILEFPPATLRIGGSNVPVGGGGYFRLLPLFVMEQALAQLERNGKPNVAMLYFHPWEFDPEQPRLPLGRLSRFRTYVGITRTQSRLGVLLSRHRFARAVDIARGLDRQRHALTGYNVTA
jgi:polysaccharide deacetylase family protein (PEP-CTERM system associated)